MKIRPILDLSNEELSHVRAGDDAVSPLGGLGKNVVASGPRSTDQNSRPTDRPIKPALFNQMLLQTLVPIGSTKDDLERQPRQAADARAAIASSKTGHRYQTFDATARHRRDQYPGRIRKKVHRPERVS